jgi:hypothetical protein
VTADDAAKREQKLLELLEREKEEFLSAQRGGGTIKDADAVDKAKKAKAFTAYPSYVRVPVAPLLCRR